MLIYVVINQLILLSFAEEMSKNNNSE